jgi:hypothetical protein
MEFDGDTKQLVYSTPIFSGESSGMRAMNIDVSEYDDIFICGQTKSAVSVTIESTNYPGLYFDPVGVDTHDGFVMWLSPVRDLRWYTRFGGESGSDNENIRSVAFAKGSLYATGASTADFSQGQFFPLHDPGAPAYFSPIGNQDYSAFITTFCGLWPTTDIDDDTSVTELNVTSTTDGRVFVNGLNGQVHPYEFYDSQGKLLERGVLSSSDGQARLELPLCAASIYILRINGVASQVIKLHHP